MNLKRIMKELTSEQKTKRYDEALERARKIHSETEFDYEKGMMEEIFPELAESEDEKIRRELIKFIKKRNRSGCDYDYDKWIAWLEKQSAKEVDARYENLEELLVADNIYQMSMNEAMVEEAKSKAIKALSELSISKLLGLEKQGKQKPAEWSEEDEHTLNGIIDEIEANKASAPDYDLATYDSFLSFLESLKERIGG